MRVRPDWIIVGGGVTPGGEKFTTKSARITNVLDDFPLNRIIFALDTQNHYRNEYEHDRWGGSRPWM